MMRRIALVVSIIWLLGAFQTRAESGQDFAGDAQLQELIALRGKLTQDGCPSEKIEILESVINGLRKSKGRLSRCSSIPKYDATRIVSDIKLFCDSKAYDIISPKEKANLQELLSWLGQVKDFGQSDQMPTAIPSGVIELIDASGVAADQFDLPTWADYRHDDLAEGDLIFRRQRGYLSNHFSDLSTRENRFTHTGIVTKASDEVVIVAVCVDEQSASGEVCRQSWLDYCYGSTDLAVYRYTGAGAETVRRKIARAAEKRIGLPFDPAFDLNTKNRFYCTELVRECVNEAAGRQVIGTSRKGDFEYVAVDDCYRNEMSKVWDCRDAMPDATPGRRQTDESRSETVQRGAADESPVRRTIRFIPKNGGR